jgi:hypothetical protein
LQPLVNKVAWRLPWQGRLLNQGGLFVLAKSTLSAIPVHISMAISIAPSKRSRCSSEASSCAA